MIFTHPDYRKLAESVFFLEIPLVYGNYFIFLQKCNIIPNPPLILNIHLKNMYKWKKTAKM